MTILWVITLIMIPEASWCLVNAEPHQYCGDKVKQCISIGIQSIFFGFTDVRMEDVGAPLE